MKHLKIALIALLLTGLTKTNINAQDASNPWVVGFGLNIVDVRTPKHFRGVVKDYLNGSIEDLNIIPSISRITAERYLNKGFTIQLAGSLNKIEKGLGYISGDPKTSDIYYSIDTNLKYDLNSLFGETGWFDPYVNLGIGYQTIAKNSDFIVIGGVGFNTWFNKNIGLNFQSGYKHGFESTGRDVFQHTLGLVIKFGGADTDGDGIMDDKDNCPNVPGLKAFNGCPDSDNDGIIDSKDSCPNVAGLKSLNGCPDSDGDGVIDSEDKCPKVKGLKSLNGCPDSDGDGVINSEDKCPKVKGAKNNNGCPWSDKDKDGVLDKDDKCIDVAGPASNNGCPEVVTPNDKVMADLNNYAKTILFETSKTSFKKETYSVLIAITKILKEYPNSNFVIGGHTDSSGSSSFNQVLSEKRANSVKNYLITNGIVASRLTAIGFGEANPIDTNATSAGRKNNRRVEVTLK